MVKTYLKLVVDFRIYGGLIFEFLVIPLIEFVQIRQYFLDFAKMGLIQNLLQLLHIVLLIFFLILVLDFNICRICNIFLHWKYRIVYFLSDLVKLLQFLFILAIFDLQFFNLSLQIGWDVLLLVKYMFSGET